MSDKTPMIEVAIKNCGGTAWIKAKDERAAPSWLTPAEAFLTGITLSKHYGENFKGKGALPQPFSIGEVKIEERKIGGEVYVALRARGSDWSAFTPQQAASFGARLEAEGEIASIAHAVRPADAQPLTAKKPALV